MRFLVLRLEAPLMSFGDVAIDELRPSDQLPGTALVTGLLANALGYTYTQRPELARLQERLVMGSRLDQPGQELVDYQNAHIDRGDLLWRGAGKPCATRAGGVGSYRGPVQRWRHYRADSRVTVVLTLDPPDESPTLEQVAQALSQPFRPLFLGRVCCPPARPLFSGETVEADGVRQALVLAAPWPNGKSNSADILGEWPAGESPELAGWAGQDWHRLERHDRRDWIADAHAGGRQVIRGLVSRGAPVAAAPQGG